MGSLNVDYLQKLGTSTPVPVSELKTRVVQYFQAEYTGGEWNPGTGYSWIPGAFNDFTPKRADSRIKYIMRLPLAWVAAGHAISHFYFIAGGQRYWYWSESGTYIENAKTFEFDVPSWGTTVGRIGLQHRSYAEDNHEVRLYTTYYWNGTGRSVQNARGHLIIEEYVV
jgi:hypothetical protein